LRVDSPAEMAADKQVLQWVSDQLLSPNLLGYSDRVVVDFIVATAKAAGSPDLLVDKLSATGTLSDGV
jgi:hypothetical protein